jgi:uncharacterized membrane protein YgcG
MKLQWLNSAAAAGVVACGLLACGCGDNHFVHHSPPPLGSISDSIWQRQEHNAEASDFVVYQHEFKEQATRLNQHGEDHVQQIAQRLLAGQNFPVVIERSDMTARQNTEYKYPVHPNPALDMARRQIVVRALSVMGVGDADERVVVAPATTEGYRANEAIRAYNRSFSGRGGFGGGFGGGGFGGGLGGGFGGGGFF